MLQCWISIDSSVCAAAPCPARHWSDSRCVLKCRDNWVWAGRGCSTAALQLQRWERAGGKQMHQLAFILIAKVSLYSRSGKNHDWISSKTAANGENLRKRCHLSRKLSGERGPLLLASRHVSEVWLFCTHRSHNSKASFWYLTVRENFYHNFLRLKYPEKDPTIPTTSLLIEGLGSFKDVFLNYTCLKYLRHHGTFY